ncbi:MAG: threonylcarbamoyl-AMP synthase [Acidobacteriaceae bacterium]|nr:threonylcarbamoyl-AMP synthase [Acidobacteriaceae bacterium]
MTNQRPSDEELERAAQAIRSGELVAFPTETVYGLGANALDASAVEKIYVAKNRPYASPLIVHVSDEWMARSVTAEWPELAHRLAEQFWPGPLTMVIRKAAAIPEIVTAGLESVGVRVPSHPVSLDLIRRSGVPIAAPSANRFGEISPTRAEHVRAGLGERVAIVLDGGPSQVGIESTVVSLSRNPPAVLRPGMISTEDLEAASGVRWDREMNLPRVVEQEPHESPGLNLRHYAPRTPFYVLERGATEPAGRGRVLQMPDCVEQYAGRLYDELHRADAEAWDWIAVPDPPELPQWEGIRDRLRRASTQTGFAKTASGSGRKPRGDLS